MTTSPALVRDHFLSCTKKILAPFSIFLASADSNPGSRIIRKSHWALLHMSISAQSLYLIIFAHFNFISCPF